MRLGGSTKVPFKRSAMHHQKAPESTTESCGAGNILSSPGSTAVQGLHGNAGVRGQGMIRSGPWGLRSPAGFGDNGSELATGGCNVDRDAVTAQPVVLGRGCHGGGHRALQPGHVLNVAASQLQDCV